METADYEVEHQLELDESDRQLVLLALGHLAAQRPGWRDCLRRIAERIDNPGAPMFESFREMKLKVPTL